MAVNHQKLSFARLRMVFFFGMIILLGLVSMYIASPFFYPIFWAAVLAVMFAPFYQWLAKHLRHETLASILTVVVVVLSIILPLVLVALLVLDQSFLLYHTVIERNPFDSVNDVTDYLAHTALAPYLDQIREQWSLHAASVAQAASNFIFTQIKVITQNSVSFFFMLFLTLYTLYYFLKDGERIAKRIMHLSPLGEEYEIILYKRFVSTVRATMKSAFVIGGLQGILGGILFSITGVTGAVVWGVIMVAFSIIPGLGSFVVWLPAGVIMLLMGNVWQGITILVVGTLVISVVDNLLRPLLIGKDTQMHNLVVLFSTLGGIFIFGLSGFVVGPIVAAMFLSFVNMYDYYYQNELDDN